MSYLKFDKNLLINLDQSLTKEMLRTNQAGAYHCSTLPGCNTRKQHGLLVIPIPEKDNRSSARWPRKTNEATSCCRALTKL